MNNAPNSSRSSRRIKPIEPTPVGEVLDTLLQRPELLALRDYIEQDRKVAA